MADRRYDKGSPENRACIARAGSDEPMFVLLGRDPTMVALLVHWARAREDMLDVGLIPDTPEERAHVAEVRRMTHAVVDWQAKRRAPSRQRAYADQRAKHHSAFVNDPDAPHWVG